MTDDRSFTGSDRAALFAAAGGLCAECGAPLPAGFHADHRVAHAAGGLTKLANGQALCPPCNLAKSGPRGLRAWQRDALTRYVADQPRDWLVVATPGAGKTRLAVECASALLAGYFVSQIVVVVPTEHLKNQWASAFAAARIDIAPDWQNSTPAWPAGFDGVAVTYAQVASSVGSALLAVHVGSRPTLVILDEIHHCGDSTTWGDSVTNAFSAATRRIGLSGTPFRSDGARIPFITYNDAGTGVADVHYGYGEALRDEVVRPVWFPRRGGRMEWAAPDGETWSATFDEEVPDPQLNQRLRTAIDTNGDWLDVTLRDAHADLCRIRSEHPDAGGLVVADSIHHAHAIGAKLAELVNAPVSVVSSDDPAASDTITRFAASTEPWMVSVKMVSEGVDVPRLMVGVWATAVTTELFFRQVVGRFVRTRNPDENGVVFIPDDQRLRTWAATIAERRDHVLDADADDLLDDADLDGPGTGGQRSQLAFQPISSEATDSGVVVAGEQLTAAELIFADQMKATDPDFARFPTPQVALLLRRAGLAAAVGAAPAVGEEPDITPAYRRRQQLRSANHRIAGRIKYATGLDFAEVHRALNVAAGIVAVDQASVEELAARIEVAQQWLSGERPLA